MSVFLLRHPEVAQAAGICYGSMDCIPDEVTMATAVNSLITPLLRMVPGGKPIRFFSSPLERCAGFAHRLAVSLEGQGAAPDVLVDPRLREIDFGSWEGLAWDAIPRSMLDEWAADPWHYKPGGKECASDVLARWRSFRATHMATPEAMDSVKVLVTHAGIIRMAMYDSGMLTQDSLWLHRVPHAQLLAWEPGV
jgi:alpha-ribazole phosphatase